MCLITVHKVDPAARDLSGRTALDLAANAGKVSLLVGVQTIMSSHEVEQCMPRSMLPEGADASALQDYYPAGVHKCIDRACCVYHLSVPCISVPCISLLW